MAKPGPKLKSGVSRYQNGSIKRVDRGERPDKIMAVALAQHHRKGNSSPLAGYAFGRMFMGGMIDQRQFDAAETFTRRAVRYQSVITGTLPRYKSPLADLIKRDLEQQREQEREFKPADFSLRSAPLDDVDRNKRIIEEYDAIQTALADAGMYCEGNAILMRVCVLDRDIDGPAAMGAFRCALNVIARRLQL